MKDFLRRFDSGAVGDEEIARGMHLSYKNSRRLARESRILSWVGSPDRAMALAVLGLEELARIPLLLNAVLIAHDDNEAWQALWKKLRSHSIKQGVWASYGRRLEMFGSQDAKFFANRYPQGLEPLLDKLKQCGFYVSYFNGHFMEPRHFAAQNRKWLRYLLSNLSSRIRALNKMHGKREYSARVVSAARRIRERADLNPELREVQQSLRDTIVKD